ncbi:hypothetical protein C2869_06870 [Saccharobesus litoralis]|uniref:Sel1 repeat family protein n=1 Tax=Saccharobesus litoralis TaxID=2172099 RepID=A0A2S0VPM9_9ALTE|nr:SEL1-like repeat protein [Saccharobesus litoralis]AWB66175.1 hypothetical protein C2869_06870 [Saccharobesus litoralis]
MLKKRINKGLVACFMLGTVVNTAQADLVTAYQAYQNKDYKLAAQHFELSAHLGHAKSQSVMAQLYLHGAGVEKDLVKSYVYYSLANDNQPSADLAKNAKAVFAHLSEDQKQQAKNQLKSDSAKWGEQALQTNIMPSIADKPLVLNPGRRVSASQRVSGSIFAVKRTTLSSAVLEYDIAPDGTARDIGVSHSYFVNKSGLRNMVNASYEYKHKVINKPAYQTNTIERQRTVWGQTTVTREFLKTDSPKIYKHIRQLEKLVKQDNADAKYQLAMYIIAFPALQTSKKEAFELLEQAAEAGHVKASTEYARFLILGRYTRRDIATGLDYLVKAAQSGESRAQYRLGREFLSGQIVKQDQQKAIFWLKQAVNGNDENAKYWLARALLDQEQTTSDELSLATQLLAEVEINHENNPNWHYYNAKALLKQNKRQQGLEWFEDALEHANDLEWNTEQWRTEFNQLKQTS